jgi:hypothetical protein
MAAAAKTVKMSKYRPTMDQAKVSQHFNGAKFEGNVEGAQESIPRNRFQEIDSASLCNLAAGTTTLFDVSARQSPYL